MQENQSVQNEGFSLGYTSANLVHNQIKPVNLVDPRTSQSNATATQGSDPAQAATQNTQSPDLQKELEALQKRFNDRTSYYDKRIEQLVESEKQKLDALAAKDREIESLKISKRELPASAEELETFAKDLPVWDRVIEAKAMKIVEERMAVAQKEIDRLNQKLQEDSINKVRNKVKELHPDVDTLEKDPQFVKWFNEQPQGIKNLVLSMDPYEISRGIDLFKRESGYKTEKDRKLEASMAVRTDAATIPEANKPKVWTTSEIKKMTPREYERHADAINAAMREGRVVQG